MRWLDRRHRRRAGNWSSAPSDDSAGNEGKRIELRERNSSAGRNVIHERALWHLLGLDLALDGRPLDGEDQDALVVIDEGMGSDDCSLRACTPKVSTFHVRYPELGIVIRREFVIAVGIGEDDPVRDHAAE